MTKQLNLPSFNFRFRDNKGKKEIFDIIRKKFITLTPEEWVRQNFIMYLIDVSGVPKSHIAVELSLKVNKMQKRADITVFDKNGKPLMLIECKSTSVNVNQAVFDQAARYNIKLNVPYLIVTNGLMHYCCHINHADNQINFIDSIPLYSDIC